LEPLLLTDCKGIKAAPFEVTEPPPAEPVVMGSVQQMPTYPVPTSETPKEKWKIYRENGPKNQLFQ